MIKTILVPATGSERDNAVFTTALSVVNTALSRSLPVAGTRIVLIIGSPQADETGSEILRLHIESGQAPLIDINDGPRRRNIKL